MKQKIRKPLFLGLLGLATATLLSNCIDPYAINPNYPHQQVTTYSIGYEVRDLPYGYNTEIIGGTRYYHYNGTYYRPRSGRYVVVEAPRLNRNNYNQGYDERRGNQTTFIRELPRGYRTLTHRGIRYYHLNNIYYQQQGSGYIIVRRPF